MFELKKIDIWNWAKTNAFYSGLIGVLFSIILFISELVRWGYLDSDGLKVFWLIPGLVVGGLILGAVFAFLYNLIAGYYSGLKMDFVKNQNNDYYEIRKIHPLDLGLVILLYLIIPTLLSLIWFFYNITRFDYVDYEIGYDNNSYYWLLLIASILAIAFYLAAGILLAWFYNWLASHQRGFKIKVDYLSDSNSYVLKKFKIIDFSMLSALLSCAMCLVSWGFFFIFRWVVVIIIEGQHQYLGYLGWDIFGIYGGYRYFGVTLIAVLVMMAIAFVGMFFYGLIFSALYNLWSRRAGFIRFWLSRSKN